MVFPNTHLCGWALGKTTELLALWCYPCHRFICTKKALTCASLEHGKLSHVRESVLATHPSCLASTHSSMLSRLDRHLMQYKLAVTDHRCLQHRAPRYLADYCVPVSEVPGHQHLRSARCDQMPVLQVYRSTFGTRAFSVARPRVWNSLPDHLWDPAVDPEQIRWDLKTYLFAGHSKC